jgi:hypothetical protein
MSPSASMLANASETITIKNVKYASEHKKKKAMFENTENLVRAENFASIHRK